MLGGLFLGASGSGLLGTGNGVHKVPSSWMSWRVGGGHGGVVDVVERGVGGNISQGKWRHGKRLSWSDGLRWRAGDGEQPRSRRHESASFLSRPPLARATVAIFKGGSSSVWTRHGPARFSAELSPTEQPFGKRSWKVKAGHSSHLLWRPEPNIHNTSPLPQGSPPHAPALSAAVQARKDRKRKPSKQQTPSRRNPSKIHTTISTRLRVVCSSYSLLETTTTTTSNSYP